MCTCVCVCVCVLALVIWHAKSTFSTRYLAASSVACLAVQYFPTLSQKRHDYRGKKLPNIKWVF